MKNILKSMSAPFVQMVAVVLVWQAMHELYKFDECDTAVCVSMFVSSFCAFLQANRLRDLND